MAEIAKAGIVPDHSAPDHGNGRLRRVRRRVARCIQWTAGPPDRFHSRKVVKFPNKQAKQTTVNGR